MNKKICVYTCITGNYDELKNPEIIEDNIDYYCFTNNKSITSNIWKIIYIEDKKITNQILARKIKILGHDKINGKYDIYVWMDSCLKITKPINQFIDNYCDFSKYDLFIPKHHARKNIKEEMQACLYHGKETLENVEKLKQFYKQEKYKYEDNLCESTIIVRNYSANVQKAMQLWFKILSQFSGRDQLSFNYAASVTGLNFLLLDLIVWANEWFRAYNHNSKKDKYSIYFKQNENDSINEYKDGDKIYKRVEIKSNSLTMDINVLKKCNYIDIDVSMLSKYVILETQIEYKNNSEYQYVNIYKYGNNIISKNDDSILRLKGPFNENDKIVVNIKLFDEQIVFFNNYINELKNDLANQLRKKDEDYKQLKDDYDCLNKNYNDIINSKRWKTVDKLANKFKK